MMKIQFNNVINADRKYIKSNVINGLDLKTKNRTNKYLFMQITKYTLIRSVINKVYLNKHVI